MPSSKYDRLLLGDSKFQQALLALAVAVAKKASPLSLSDKDEGGRFPVNPDVTGKQIWALIDGHVDLKWFQSRVSPATFRELALLGDEGAIDALEAYLKYLEIDGNDPTLQRTYDAIRGDAWESRMASKVASAYIRSNVR